MNSQEPMIQRDPHWAVQGPIRKGKKFVQELGQSFDVIVNEVQNNAEPIAAFGTIMLEVDPKNTNKGELHALLTAQTGGVFAFAIRTDKTLDAGIDTLLKFATLVTKTNQLLAKPQLFGTIPFTILKREHRNFDELHLDVTEWFTSGFTALEASVEIEGFIAEQTEEVINSIGAVITTGADVFWSGLKRVNASHVIRTTIVLDDVNAVRKDFTFNPETGTLITTERQLVANTAGVPPTPTQGSGVVVKQTQLNENWSLRETATYASVTGYKLAVPATTNVSLPDQLESVEVEWAEAEGEGSGDTDWTGSASGTSWSLSSQTGAQAESSAALIPELVVVTKQTWGHNVPTVLYYMIIEKVAGEITLATILSQLLSLYGVTATMWPLFKPKTYVCALSGGKVAVASQVSAHSSMAYSSSSLSWSRTTSRGKKIDHSLTSGTRVIPNVLCSGFSINETRTRDVAALATLGFDSGLIPSFSFTDPETIDSCEGVVTGDFSATDPPSIPTTGKYVLNIGTRPFQNLAGFMMVNLEVIDATYFA